MIPQRDLSIISNNLLKERGGRRIPDQTIELDYVLGWFLAELAKHPFNERLAFKGGTALRRCHIGEYRFSEDLDFTLLSTDEFDPIKMAFEDVATKVTEQTGMAFGFSRPDPHQHQNSHTFYMAFTGPMQRQREFKVDITKTEEIVNALERKPVLVTYGAFDFPNDRAINAYSVNEIAAEKLLALTDPQRSQPRDLYDLWYLASEGLVELPMLDDAVGRKLKFRGRSAEGLAEALDKKEKLLQATWKARLDPQMASTPEFETVLREARRALRQSAIFDLVLENHRKLG
jgi:predicted nucleotidyltransferase component of viral defense system